MERSAFMQQHEELRDDISHAFSLSVDGSASGVSDFFDRFPIQINMFLIV
jgi:hypothetical protein